ncbi:hypothetical protein CRUP_009548 [Coryphaenoides rupestris]|nr:hypothetical protein CRUP_009548 [Coryphaenoides rupestris]
MVTERAPEPALHVLTKNSDATPGIGSKKGELSGSLPVEPPSSPGPKADTMPGSPACPGSPTRMLKGLPGTWLPLKRTSMECTPFSRGTNRMENWSEFSIRFVPRENGVHSIDVRFNGSHVPGSPFNIRVGDPGQAGDPGMVSAFGPGLEGGSTGVASEFLVSTCNAGSGALSVTIDGPSKVKMDCVECAEGYKVTYTPMAPGSYLISIRYGGLQHITVTKSSAAAAAVGFPSLPKFSSDASRAVSRGAGLSKAFVGQKNMFTVDCSKAGTNMLMVGVHGPQAPCEEVYVKHMGNRMYNVTYTVKEQGSYILIVKWGDDHITGSPFHVTVP